MHHISKDFIITTPAFLLDLRRIVRNLKAIINENKLHTVNIFYPLKSFTLIHIFDSISCYFQGYSASSLFEVKLAKNDDKQKLIHFTSPGLRHDHLKEISYICDYISFNSLTQLKHFCSNMKNRSGLGIRINPQLSFVEDKRYDPCRKHSKLGIPLNTLSQLWKNEPNLLNEVEGILIHSNCESENLNELSQTVLHIEEKVPGLFEQLRWVNLGGGYLFETSEDLNPLSELVNYLKSKYDLEIFFEPGKAIIGNAGYIVSSVLDLFESDGKTIAILDTTVNHMPEVFEYQVKPKVFDTVKNSKYKYILAGCTCLAGDIFGEYSFREPLEVGSRVIFENVGAYTLVKAHMFNGVNLPDIYALTLDGKLELKKRHTYEEFLQRWGGWALETKRKAVIDS